MTTVTRTIRAPHGLPHAAGVGFKPEHAQGLLGGEPCVEFIEVHAENYMGEGGAPHRLLSLMRERYPLSLHGVGLSIGGEEPLDEEHLDRLAALILRYRPASFSEHLAWSSHDGAYLNDLLPVAYDTPTLLRVCAHVDRCQDRLGVRMLLENPSTYVEFRSSTWDEVDFIAEIARRTGCGLLLDVNNVQVSCVNHGRDARSYIDRFPVELVGEIHLGGFAPDQDSLGAPLLIDAHDRPVDDEVWSLYERTLARTGPIATLIEWDNDVPELPVLLDEARRAQAALDRAALRRGAAA